MKKLLNILIVISTTFVFITNSFAATTAGQEMRTQVLIISGILDDDSNMNEFLTRKELAKMVTLASTYKDSISTTDLSSAFNDVPNDSLYSPYIKIATNKKYMSSYLNGLFKPDDFVTYKDLTRACLALLGYENSDFTGNQILGRFETFCSLKMNTDIDRDLNDYITKKDAVNAIYNTLKTNKKGGSAYGPTVFNKMTVNSDGELNAQGLIKIKLEGPFILKKHEAINLAVPFSLENANIFMNGQSSNTEELGRELGINGFLIYYYNTTTNTLYIYKEGNTLESTTKVKKGIVNHIYYSASDTVTPNKVEIDLSSYTLSSSEVKFAFSHAGTLHVGDQIVFIYNDTSEGGNDDGSANTVGSITHAYLYNLNY